MEYCDSDNEFEEVYHNILHPTYTLKEYENQLLSATISQPFLVRFIIGQFVTLLPEKEFKLWYRWLRKDNILERDKTAKDKKQRRMVIRRLYRVSQRSIKVRRVLDLVLERVREEQAYE